MTIRLWGKFGLRNNRSQSKVVTEPEEFFNFMFSAKYKVKYFSFVSDQVALIQLQEGELYQDADSLIFFTRAGDYELELGRNLGELTNVLVS